MSSARLRERLSPGLTALLGLWLLALAALCCLLQPQWAANPELAHGYLMPFVMLLLVREGARHGTQRHPDADPKLWAGISLLGLGALLATAVSGLYAMSFGWGHPLAGGAATLAFVCLSLILLLILASARLLPVNWQVCCAAFLWLLCCPAPPGAYARLTVSLQLAVTELVLGSLNLLGIAATRHGNVIELLRGSVGVEEACSGIRSLVTCSFAALVLSAWFPRGGLRRSLLVASAVPIALGMNFARSLILTLLTSQGINIAGWWHDWTGYTVLSLATLLLIAFALWLEKHDPRPLPASTKTEGSGPAKIPTALALAALLPACLLAATLYLKTLSRPAATSSLPDLNGFLPETVEGWQVQTDNSIARFQSILQADALLQRDYLRNDSSGRTALNLYVASWAPGKSNPGQIALHTPEVCWPGAGWTELPDAPKSKDPLLASAEQHRFTHPSGTTYQVWYWLLTGNQAVHGLNPYKPAELLQLSLKHGFTAPQPHLFVRIASNRQWEEIRDTDPIRQLLAKTGISSLSTEPR